MILKLNFSISSALAILSITSALLPPQATAQALPIYQQSNAALQTRVDDLFSRLTQSEKLSLLTGTDFTSQPLPRLNIKGMSFSDAGQGVRGGSTGTLGPATAFPGNATSASSWDRQLMYQIGEAIGDEAKNKGTGTQIELGPGVNIHRSPLCGRNSEYLGEDPYLAAQLCVPFIEGLQSTGTGACVKHFICNNEEVDRGGVSADVDERALREIYLPAFEAACKVGHVRSIMAAYNRVNGIYCASNWYLLKHIVRDEWKWDGLVMSDWGAAHDTASPINAEMDLEMPGPGIMDERHLQTCLANGTLTQDRVDVAVKDVLRATILSGVADVSQPKPNPAEVGSEPHVDLATRAAIEGMVLLKNDRSTLPLDPATIKTLAIVGPCAQGWHINADGSGLVQPDVEVNAFDGIAQRLSGHGIAVKFADIGYGGAPTIPANMLKPSSGTGSGLTGEYFGNQNLTGQPVTTRQDATIDFNWANTPPPGAIGPDNFSIRWTGTIKAPETGKYTFAVTADDGCRLWINGTRVVDHWEYSTAAPVTGEISLVAGRTYPIRIEYHQKGGPASIKLAWTLPSNPQPDKENLLRTVKAADAVIVCVGGEEEGEGDDRSTMLLAGDQANLVRLVATANPRTVVVVNNGGPILMTSWIHNVPAVLDAGFPGEMGGKALAALIFGDETPSGKLVDTLGSRREDYPDYGNFPGVKGHTKYAEGIYVGYRAFDKRKVAPLFPFGYGLSYTTFRYSPLKLSSLTWKPDRTLLASAQITNTGTRKGAEIAELYIEPKSPKADRPIRELKGFDRVDLAPGETGTVNFTLTPRDFAYCDVPDKEWRADPGEYLVELAASSRDIRQSTAVRLTDDWTDPIPTMGAKDPYAPVPSLATGKLATASSMMHNNLPSYAVDGDPTTRWESEWSDPQWIEIDLGKPTKISKVVLSWETAHASAYQIQISNDNKAWTTVYSTTRGLGAVEKIPLTPVTTRWVRLYCTARPDEWGDSLFSFDIF